MARPDFCSQRITLAAVLQNGLQKAKGGSREIIQEKFATTQVRVDGVLNQNIRSEKSLDSEILDIFRTTRNHT